MEKYPLTTPNSRKRKFICTKWHIRKVSDYILIIVKL